MHCMFIANLHAVSCDVYINAQMVLTMLNEILLGLLIIIEYLMILLILMKRIVLNSLHRDCYMLYGDKLR